MIIKEYYKKESRRIGFEWEEGGQKYDVYVWYQIGGHDLSYEPRPRGYNLSVQPYTEDNGFRRILGYSGTKMFLEEATKYSYKRLSELADANLSRCNKNVIKLFNDVKQKAEKENATT